jgi:DNA-binding transcriptional regulator YhcF (GntR family)
MNITVDTASPVPPYEQIRARLAELIVLGILAPETPLPSVRQLATDLGLAPGTVQRAYTELRNEGLVGTRSRQRVVVAGSPGSSEDGAAARERELTAAAQRFVDRCRRLGAGDPEIRRKLGETLGEAAGSV